MFYMYVSIQNSISFSKLNDKYSVMQLKNGNFNGVSFEMKVVVLINNKCIAHFGI